MTWSKTQVQVSTYNVKLMKMQKNRIVNEKVSLMGFLKRVILIISKNIEKNNYRSWHLLVQS